MSALLGGGGGRTLLQANRTYFVNATTGSDSNNGLSLSAPLLTLQKAMDIIVQQLDLGGFTVTISASGIFTAGIEIKSWVGGGQVTLDCNGGTISTTTADCIVLNATIVGQFHFQNVTLTSVSGYGCDHNGSGIIVQGPGVTYNNCGIGVVTPAAQFWCFDDYTISGTNDVGAHMFVDTGYILNIVNTITISGAPIFSLAFAYASDVATMIAYSLTFVNAIAVTGTPRYSVSLNSIIQTNGGGPNYFPGDSPGASTTGGQYS